MAEHGPAGEGHSRAFMAYLLATALVCGALVMVVEVLGSRVIGPFFGVSLFVWTSLITVTLVALAGGYAAGGVLSDRRSSPDWLYGIIFAAGLLVLLVPFLKAPVLRASLPLGLRWGALASAGVLFGPSLFLLGCVSPYLVKIAAREVRNIGRTVGVLYSISTVGSFLGTVLTGFVLIAYFGVSRIFQVVGGLLVLLAVGYFLFFRRRRLAAAAAVVPLLLGHGDTLMEKTLPNGVAAKELVSLDTFYGDLKVVEYGYGPVRTRELLIDSQIQGGIDMSSAESVYPYAYFMSLLPRAVNPGGKTCLVIGLGAGAVPTWYARQGIEVDTVEINPEVVRLARDYFGFGAAGRVIVEDARYYLNRSPKRYDYIILDAVNGDTTPFHILSRESLALIKSRLADGGVLGFNLIGSLRQHTFMTASVIRTLEGVFRTVQVCPGFSPEEGEGFGNISVIAYDAPAVPLRPERFLESAVHPLARETVNRFLGRTFRFPPGTPALIVTDDYNPIDFFDVWLKERYRLLMLQGTDIDLLV